MDEQRLKEIEARAEKATEGPWYWNTFHGSTRDYEDVTIGDWSLARLPSGYANAAVDAQFIANARQDIPDLIVALRSAYAVIRAIGELHMDMDVALGIYRILVEHHLALHQQEPVPTGHEPPP